MPPALIFYIALDEKQNIKLLWPYSVHESVYPYYHIVTIKLRQYGCGSFPAVVELRRQIAEAAIGEVKYVHANIGFPIGHHSPSSHGA